MLRSLLGFNLASTWGGFWDDFGWIFGSSWGLFRHVFGVIFLLAACLACLPCLDLFGLLALLRQLGLLGLLAVRNLFVIDPKGRQGEFSHEKFSPARP